MQPATRATATLLALLAAGPATAQPQSPLSSVADADPVELARVVQRIGDSAVIAALAPDRPVVERLAAVRAAPAMRSPERALTALVEIARGRDSLLAPAAALAALRIATSLDADDLAAREALPGDIEAARSALEALAADESARPDIRRAAALAADALAHLFAT